MDSTKRFSSRVKFYIRSRPKYPLALLRFFQDELKLTPQRPVADIGSGTGFLTELFVRNGNPTFAVEPNTEMRLAAEELLRNSRNFHSIVGTAEATTLANSSVDFITAGQAFHWFDRQSARREFIRVLRPGGLVCLIWNERNCQTALGREYEALTREFQTDATTNRRQDAASPAVLAEFFSGPFQTRQFDNPQSLDRAGFVDRLNSSSYMPLPDDPRHAAVLQAAIRLFDAHQQNGSIVIAHDTHLYYGPLLT